MCFFEPDFLIRHNFFSEHLRWLYIFCFGARGIGANDASARVFDKNMKEVKNFVCCVALGTTMKEIKVENVAESAKIVTNV